MTVPLAGPPPPPAEKSRWDRFWLALKEEVGDFLSALKPLPTVVFVVGGLAMWLWVYYGGDVFFNEYFSPRLKEHGWALQSVGVARCCYFYGSAALFLCAFPHLALRITTRFTPEDPVPTAGWGLGDWRIGLPAYGIFYGVMLVILAVIARQPAFRAAYRRVHAAAPVPWAPPEADARLLDLFLLQKAAYELCYEAANRIDWVPVPLGGLVAIVERITGGGTNG